MHKTTINVCLLLIALSFSPLPTNTNAHTYGLFLHIQRKVHATRCTYIEQYPMYAAEACHAPSRCGIQPILSLSLSLFAMNLYTKMYVYTIALKGINDTQSASQWHSKSVLVFECAFRMYELRLHDCYLGK